MMVDCYSIMMADLPDSKRGNRPAHVRMKVFDSSILVCIEKSVHTLCNLSM